MVYVAAVFEDYVSKRVCITTLASELRDFLSTAPQPVVEEPPKVGTATCLWTRSGKKIAPDLLVWLRNGAHALVGNLAPEVH